MSTHTLIHMYIDHALLFLSPTLSGRIPGAPSSAEEAVLLLAQVNLYIYMHTHTLIYIYIYL